MGSTGLTTGRHSVSAATSAKIASSTPSARVREQKPPSNLSNPPSRISNPTRRIPNPPSAICDPRSNLPNPRSNLRSPRSNLRSPRSNLRSPRGSFWNPRLRFPSAQPNLFSHDQIFLPRGGRFGGAGDLLHSCPACGEPRRTVFIRGYSVFHAQKVPDGDHQPEPHKLPILTVELAVYVSANTQATTGWHFA